MCLCVFVWPFVRVCLVVIDCVCVCLSAYMLDCVIVCLLVCFRCRRFVRLSAVCLCLFVNVFARPCDAHCVHPFGCAWLCACLVA